MARTERWWWTTDKWLQTLANGQALILPTETVYGLFADALNEAAVKEVYHLKKRPQDKAMNLNVGDLQTIYAFSKQQPSYLEQLYQAFLPGPLTLILQANEAVPYWINSGMETVGFRIPNHPLTLDLIRTYGPLIGPSANLSGQESGRKFQHIQQAFSKMILGIEDDEAITGVDSTILDISGERARILRQGSITKEELLEKVPDLLFADE